MGEEKIKNIVSLLLRVADGLLDGAQAILEWPDIEKEKDNIIVASWHDLSHFIADADIRSKDERYDAYQRGVLRGRASSISNKYGLNQ